MYSRTLIADWTSAQWLWWITLYLGLGLAVPWVLTGIWAHQHHLKVQPNAKQLFRRGEVGLVSLILAISGIWDLQKSHYSALTIAVGSILLALGGIMAVAVESGLPFRQLSCLVCDAERPRRRSTQL